MITFKFNDSRNVTSLRVEQRLIPKRKHSDTNNLTLYNNKQINKNT